MTPTRYFIIAPTVRRGTWWADKNGIPPGERRFITRPDQLRGLNNPTVIMLGYPESWTPNDRQDAGRLLELADRGSMTYIRPQG